MTSHDVVALVQAAVADQEGRPLRHARSDRDRAPDSHARPRHENPGSAHERGQRIRRHLVVRQNHRHPGSRRAGGRGKASAGADRGETWRRRSTNSAAIFTRCRRWFRRSSRAACRSTSSRARGKRWSANRGSCTSIATASIASKHRRSTFTVMCSKGFYVRTYAHDIGAELGCGAHLKELRRTRSGRFDLARSVTVDEIRNAPPVDILEKILTLPEVSRMRGA